MIPILDTAVKLEQTAENGNASVYGGAVLRLLAIFALIFAATLVTPYLANFVDKLFGHSDGGKDEIVRPEDYRVNDIYDGDKNFRNENSPQDKAADERKDDNI